MTKQSLAKASQHRIPLRTLLIAFGHDPNIASLRATCTHNVLSARVLKCSLSLLAAEHGPLPDASWFVVVSIAHSVSAASMLRAIPELS